MARPLSRRLWLAVAVAGIAVGTGVAMAVINVNNPALNAIFGMLAFATLPGFGVGRGVVRARERRSLNKRRRSSGAPETGAQETSTKVRCLHCQHVQTVPISQETFACEQCNAHLKRRTAPAKSN
jgi:uncharacterized paraquat-inducible protein A